MIKLSITKEVDNFLDDSWDLSIKNLDKKKVGIDTNLLLG